MKKYNQVEATDDIHDTSSYTTVSHMLYTITPIPECLDQFCASLKLRWGAHTWDAESLPDLHCPGGEVLQLQRLLESVVVVSSSGCVVKALIDLRG